jgi:hypothetical protein
MYDSSQSYVYGDLFIPLTHLLALKIEEYSCRVIIR